MLKSEYHFGIFIARPALVSLRYSSTEHRRLDITGLRNCLSKLINDSCFLLPQELSKELYIFGKVLYKMNGPFRRHGHFQMAKRLKKLSDNCFGDEDGQLKRVLTILREFIVSIRLDEKDNLYCPSLEYFRFLLASLRSLASVFVKLATCCVGFCERMMHMLNFGHFVQVHCLLLGVVARFRADCCRRLHSLKKYFVDFASQGYLANGLKLKRVGPSSADIDETFSLVFENLDDVDQILESDRRVSGETLSPLLRKQAIDYFEHLFNVRIPEQRAKRQRMTAGVKEKKFAAQAIDFRQALVGVSAESTILSDQQFDLGVPVSRKSDKTDKEEKAVSSTLKECFTQLNRVKSAKSMRRFAVRLEKLDDRQLRPALRFLRKELEKVEKSKGEERSKSLTKCLKGVRRKLNRILMKA